MFGSATKADIAYVAMNIRPEDGAEIEAITGLSLPAALASLDHTPKIVLVFRQGDRPVAIFGALLLADDQASMFRFATAEWPNAVRQAIKFGRRVFLPKLWSEGIKALEAVTLDDPPQTAWLRLFGAAEVERFLRNGRKFVRFRLNAPA